MKTEHGIITIGTLLLATAVIAASAWAPHQRALLGAGERPGRLTSQNRIIITNPAGCAIPVALNRTGVRGRPPLSGQALQEGHWIGLEVIPLTPALAKANNITLDVQGVLVDEVTLLAAQAGLLAGDVIVAVNSMPTPGLEGFQAATRKGAQETRTMVTVYRQGALQQIAIAGHQPLGFAQLEAAPMILATDKSPHGNYGACQRCHAISKSAGNPGQLGLDQGDVLVKKAPAIIKGSMPSHGNRGRCDYCHAYR